MVKPVITNNPPSAITALCTVTFANLPFVAPVFSDNCGSVTLLSMVTTPNAQQETCNAVYSRTWTVRDNCGNTAVFTQNITVPCCEGCSPGFWKNHTELWNALSDYPATQMPAGLKFMTTTNFNLYFNLPPGTNTFANNLTMNGAISQGGGGCKALSRHAVAALLSSASGLNVAYPTGTSNFTQLYNAIRSALLSGNCSGTLFTQLEAISESDHRNCGNFDKLITVNQAMNPEPEIAVAASPNPYTDRILFTVSSEVAGMASVELYTLLGQKVADLYKGPIQKGEVKTLTYYPTTNNRKTLVYRMVVAGKVVTGKVIYLN